MKYELSTAELQEHLEGVGAYEGGYSIGEYADDSFCVMQEDDGRWATFSGSRGVKQHVKYWDSETDACTYFLGYVAYIRWVTPEVLAQIAENGRIRDAQLAEDARRRGGSQL